MRELELQTGLCRSASRQSNMQGHVLTLQPATLANAVQTTGGLAPADPHGSCAAVCSSQSASASTPVLLHPELDRMLQMEQTCLVMHVLCPHRADQGSINAWRKEPLLEHSLRCATPMPIRQELTMAPAPLRPGLAYSNKAHHLMIPGVSTDPHQACDLLAR